MKGKTATAVATVGAILAITLAWYLLATLAIWLTITPDGVWLVVK